MAGEKAAIALATDVRPELPGGECEQLDIEDLIGAPAGIHVVELREKHRIGRPPGSRNRRTIEWAEYLLARYASPLEVLAQMAVAPVELLSAQLGCTKLEAYQEKRLASIALIPFLHQKQPLAVDLTKKSVVHLTIVEDNGDGDNTDLSLTATVVERITHDEDGEKPDVDGG